MIRPALAATFVAVSLFACSGGGSGTSTSSSGNESGGGGGLDGLGAPATGTPGTTSSSGATPIEADAGGRACYGSSDGCWCGDFSGWDTSKSTKVDTCGKSAGATFCCQTNDFPSGGSCVCSNAQPNCTESVFGDTCTCSLASPSQGDKPVSTCTAKTGGVCCVEPSVMAPMCSCYDKLTTCPNGGKAVSSCSVSNLECSGKSVSSCSY